MYRDNHMVMPKALYLSNANELGITYTLDELKRISKLCKKLNLYFFIDGARLPIALAAEGYSLKDIAGVCDMFYVGGTKNGLPYGELLVIVNDELKTNFKYLLKNKLGMLAKGFIGTIMFKTYLENDYYLDMAKIALMHADRIRKEFDKYIIYRNNTNQIYLKLNKAKVAELEKCVDFEIWEEASDYEVIRLVTSYATKNEEVLGLIEVFKKLELIWGGIWRNLNIQILVIQI